jgi:hypothetical protein
MQEEKKSPAALSKDFAIEEYFVQPQSGRVLEPSHLG